MVQINTQNSSLKPMLAIVGPSASGKSAVAQYLALKYDHAIINCDSVQLYRRFHIGCAKPSAKEQALVVHHLLDVIDWDEPFDVQQYRDQAVVCIEQLRHKQQDAILCGGSGLYLRTLRWGLLEGPGRDDALRKKLEAIEEQEPGALYQQLQRQDPLSAARIEPNNLHYIIRALELTELGGHPASQLRARHGFRVEQIPMQVFALRWPPELLRQRIADRTHRMLAAGFIQEVEALLQDGVASTCLPMKSVGYRQVCQMLSGEIAHAELANRIISATWRYTKRQNTWLRREKQIRWCDMTRIDDAMEHIESSVFDT